MRIGIDISILPRGGGVSNYIRNLLRELYRLEPDLEYKLFYNSFRGKKPNLGFGDFEIVRTRIPSRILLYAWRKIDFLKIESLIGPVDLFHSPSHSPVYSYCPPAKKWVVTVHDLFTFRLNYQKRTQLKEYSVLKRMEKHADRIIAVSESTRNDLLELMPSLSSRTVVIHEGVDKSLFNVDPDNTTYRKYKIRRPYILYVGSNDSHKNLDRLLIVYNKMSERIPQSLVLVGKITERHASLLQRVKDFRLEKRVIFTGQVDKADLPSVYAASDLFVLPSIYEGFGLVLLEAMASGTPIVASNVSSIPEVVQGAGILFDPYSEEDIYSKIMQTLNNEILKTTLVRRGLIRAKELSWQKMADSTIEIYREVA